MSALGRRKRCRRPGGVVRSATAVFYGTDELLVDEAVQFALRGESGWQRSILLSVQGGQHSFIIGAGRVPEVYDAIREMGEWLRRKLLLSAAP